MFLQLVSSDLLTADLLVQLLKVNEHSFGSDLNGKAARELDKIKIKAKYASVKIVNPLFLCTRVYNYVPLFLQCASGYVTVWMYMYLSQVNSGQSGREGPIQERVF